MKRGKKIKLVEVPSEEIIDGEVVYNMGSDMASADPMAYGRLINAGKYEEAAAMEKQKGYWVLLPNGEYL